MKWPWSREVEERSQFSITDPALAEWLNWGIRNDAGVAVTEYSALGLSAVWRAVSLISQTIASLPMQTLRTGTDGVRQQVPSFLDDPGTAEYQTRFEWIETIVAHLLLHGSAFLLHIHNAAGGLTGLMPIHPLAVSVEWERDDQGRATWRKIFHVTLIDGSSRTFDQTEMTYIPALTLDGLRALSPITVARNSMGTGIAGDRAAARMFGNGALISGLVTPDEDITEEEAKQIKAGLDSKMAGVDNASTIAVINRRLTFTPWAMSNLDAQFLESRSFSISEVARWFGLPEFLLQADKQTSWGTGIAEQNRGLARMVLSPWCARIEQRLSRLLPRGQEVEFDFAGLERGSASDEVDLLLRQVAAGVLTVDEARAARNLPPLATASPADAVTLGEPDDD